MNCEFVNNQIEALTLIDINAGIAPTLQQHLNECCDCQANFNNHRAYLARMFELKTPDIEPHVAAAMLRKVSKASAQKTSNSGFLQGFIAASVLAVSIFGTWLTVTHSPDNAPLIAAQPQFYTTEVVLVIHAAEDMNDADLNIVLPQQLALQGYDNMQELSWPVDLKAGVNTLTLPVRVNTNKAIEQPLSIMAKLYHYEEEREFEIKVDLSKMAAEQKNSALVPINHMNKNA